MKKQLITTLSFILLSIAVAAQKNVIKIRPLSLLAGSVDLTYERVVTDHISVALNGSFTRNDFTKFAAGFNTSSTKLTSVVLGAYTFTPQCRIYFAGKAPSGFYLSPFLSYGNYGVAVSMQDSLNVPSSGSVTVGSFGGGAGIGYQWIIGKFSIDWNFFGIGVNGYNIALHYESATVESIKDANNIKDQLNNSVLLSGFGVSFPSSGGVTVTAPVQIAPAFSSNLSIGFAF